MDFVAGIDGGGTKARLVYEDLDTKQIRTKIFGAFNMNSIGEENFLALLNEIFSYIDSLGTCEALCIGCAGISNKRMLELIKGEIKKSKIKKYRILGDHEIALEGAFSGKEGIILISGTGSICYGKNKKQDEARAGGWGHLISSEGSAYYIGKSAVNILSKHIDKYAVNTKLVDVLSVEMGLNNREALISYVYKNDKSAVASLAKLVDMVAQEGDEIALNIIKENARYLKNLVFTVYNNLDFNGARLALLGGMFEHDTMLKETFIEIMRVENSQILCVEPENNASIGALQIASKMLR